MRKKQSNKLVNQGKKDRVVTDVKKIQYLEQIAEQQKTVRLVHFESQAFRYLDLRVRQQKYNTPIADMSPSSGEWTEQKIYRIQNWPKGDAEKSASGINSPWADRY